MNYVKFAYLYDELMSDAPYEQWVSFVLAKRNEHHLPSDKVSILDVGCGTGNIAIPLSKAGFLVTAVDLSEEMLMVAKEKSENENTSIQFFQQDMRKLKGLGSFSMIVSLCDTLNYLLEEEDVLATFNHIYQHLEEAGVFIFDVHSTNKIESIFQGNTFAHSGEDISYIWECFSGDLPYSVEHELSFFVRGSNNLYERFDELHQQRAFPIEFYKMALEQSGFELLSITGDFCLETLSESAERWFFVAHKRK